MKSVSLGVEYFSTATTATTATTDTATTTTTDTATTATTDTATTTASAINPGTTPTSFITAANAAAADTDTSIRMTKTEFLLKTSIQYKADK